MKEQDILLEDVVFQAEGIQLKLAKFNKPLFTKVWIVAVNNISGRELRIPISNDNVLIKHNDLIKLGEKGTLSFEIYIKTRRRTTKVRLVGDQTFFKETDANEKLCMTVFKNSDREIKIKITARKQNYVLKKLNFSETGIDLSLVIGEVTTSQNYEATIEVRRQHFPTKVIFDLTWVENNQYEGFLDMRKTPQIEVNDRWDIFIVIKDQKEILVEEHLLYKNERDNRYIKNFSLSNKNDNVMSLYEMQFLDGLCFWYTTKTQWETANQIAKGSQKYYHYIRQHEPDPKTIIFESFLGNAYAGNPKYLLERLLTREDYADYAPVLVYNKEQPLNLPERVRVVERNSDEYFEALGQAKYWVNNVIFSIKDKPNETKYLQTWHGTPLKKLGWDITIQGPETASRNNFHLESRNWDYLLSANTYSSTIFRRAFKYEKEMIEVGYPINDIFYQNNDLKIAALKTAYNIPEDKKVILYAPTWRDDEASYVDETTYKLPFDVQRFCDEYGDEYVLLIKLHHLVDKVDVGQTETVINVSEHEDIQELYITADILITDYSSVFFDFAHSNKPILFYAYDFEAYAEEIRGLYLDMNTELPGPLIKNESDLFTAITNIDVIQSDYQIRYQAFVKTYCSTGKGQSSDLVLDKLLKEGR